MAVKTANRPYRIGMGFASMALFAVECAIEQFCPSSSFIRGYGGDFLVVILIYTVVQAIRPVPAIPAGCVIVLFATAVEIVQLFDPAQRLGFEPGSLVHILVGSTFSALDIGMYVAGTVVAVALDLAQQKIFRTKTL